MDFKIKIGGDSAEGMRAMNESREALDKLRGGVDGVARVMQGDFIGAATGAMGALRGLWGLIVANPLLALGAGLALIIGKFMQLRSEAAEKAAEGLRIVEERTLSLRKALGDLSAMNFMERLGRLGQDKNVEGLRGEVEQARERETSAYDKMQRTGDPQSFAEFRAAQLERKLAQQRLQEAVDASMSKDSGGGESSKPTGTRSIEASLRQIAEQREEVGMKGGQLIDLLKNRLEKAEQDVTGINVVTEIEKYDEARLRIAQLRLRIAQEQSNLDLQNLSKLDQLNAQERKAKEEIVSAVVDSAPVVEPEKRDPGRGGADWIGDIENAVGAGRAGGPRMSQTTRALQFRAGLGGTFAEHLQAGELTRRVGLHGGEYGRADTRAEQLQKEHLALMKQLIQVTKETRLVAE